MVRANLKKNVTITRSRSAVKVPSKFVHHRPDRLLVVAVILLCCIGIFCLASASSVVAYTSHGDAYYWVKKQLFSLIIGGLGFYILSCIDYHRWQKWGGVVLIITIVFLLTIFTPLARERAGSVAWLNIFGFSLQPSEFVKLSLTSYLSALMAKLALSREEGEKKRLNTIFWLVLIAVSALILAQPDLGTLVIIAATSILIYLVGGGSWKWVIRISLVGLILFVAFILIKGGYQKDRFLCVLKPGYSPDKSCYQVNQSLIAVGSGGFWGRGLGESRQKYLYLPEVQNDFIFAVIAEELGWWFSLIILGLYYLIFYRGYLVARLAPDRYGQILAIGIVGGLLIQVLINLGGILNLLPMTGVTLPLISYGGSSLMAVLFGLGILANISSHTSLSSSKLTS